jgi:hypothetical protein
MQSGSSSPLDVRTVTDEADAVLAILAKKKSNQSVTDADWQRVFSSEGYFRLKKRETGLKRSFEDQDFKSFVFSDPLAARAQALQAALDKWKHADLTAAARRALAYLPDQARIRAKIYPVIKPQDNSFVFEVTTDPAIFLYLDPRCVVHGGLEDGSCDRTDQRSRKAYRVFLRSPQVVVCLQRRRCGVQSFRSRAACSLVIAASRANHKRKLVICKHVEGE